jgi:hypothetical protein
MANQRQAMQMAGLQQAVSPKQTVNPQTAKPRDPLVIKKEEVKQPKKTPEYALDNLSFKKLLLYSFLGLAAKTINDRAKKEDNNVRKIGS